MVGLHDENLQGMFLIVIFKGSFLGGMRVVYVSVGSNVWWCSMRPREVEWRNFRYADH